MLIDFHTHTSASDGVLDPKEMIARAVALKLDMLAITDHDTLAGFRAAEAEYTHMPGEMRLIPGIEFSCQWSGVTIHILGLGMDPDHDVMKAAVAKMLKARHERAEKIAQRLEKIGFSGALEGALAVADGSQIGRPHFASWMVDQGHVADAGEAFHRFLGQGKTGDVKAFWPELAEVTGWIDSAGGAAVIAHPLKYKFTGMKLRRLIMAFVEARGSGIEVLSGRQTSDQTAHLSRLAQEFDLEISVGSDFHRDSSYGAPLGVELRPFEGLRGVWERWSIP
ncbi:MAG: putative metal-dependent phosphoesterase TrpH [Halioglobus sp.]